MVSQLQENKGWPISWICLIYVCPLEACGIQTARLLVDRGAWKFFRFYHRTCLGDLPDEHR